MELKKKTNKKLIGIILAILGLVLVFSGYYMYKMTYTDNNGEDKIDESDEELLYNLDVYKYESGLLCKEKNDEYCKEIAFTIKTKTENTKVLAFDEDYKFVLYEDDNSLKVFNRNLEESQGILLENSYKEYSIYKNNNKDNISGIIYKTNDDRLGYFNVATGNKLYEGKYDTNYLHQINDDYLSTVSEKEVYLLNSKEEKVELTFTGVGPSFSFSSYGNNKYLFVLNECAGDCSIKKIYSNDFKEIYSGTIYEQNIGFSNDKLYFLEKDQIKKVDMNGNITDGKTYNDLKGIINNYAVYVDSNKIKLENIESGEIKEITNWGKTYNYDTYTSGYYSREQLDNMGETEKQEGIYVVVYYNIQDAKGNYGMEYCYASDGSIVTYEIKAPMGGRAKPVLYLYPTETTNVKVSFAHPEYLTTTYPKYNNVWEVKASPNGDLIDKNNKYYYALYWDEIRYDEVDFHEGFYVEKENAIDFLEEKLDILGLNAREKNEFIMYWLPILETNEKSLVYFEQTNEREHSNKLKITPTPDSMLRVSIHIKKVNEKVNIKEQRLETFKRTGFSVVEWGGMTY